MVSKEGLILQINGCAFLPFFTFVLLKNILGRSKILSQGTRAPLIILCAVATILVDLLILPAILLTYAIKTVVQARLEQEDPNFHSMMSSVDALWSADDKTRAVISIFMVIESNTDGVGVYRTFKDLLPKAWQEHGKIQCTREKKYGYFYWRRQTAYDEQSFITTSDEYDSIEGWNKLMDLTAAAPMPLDDKGTFHMVVGTTDLRWSAGAAAGTRHYPIFIRFHHSAGDGASVANFMVTQFCKDGVEHIGKYLDGFNGKVMKKFAKRPTKGRFWDAVKKLADADLKFAAPVDAWDKTLAPAKTLRESGYLSYFCDQGQQISKKVDVVRTKYGLTFTKLMLALAEESLGQLYTNNIIKDRPNKNSSAVLTCLTAILQSLKIQDNISFSNDGHPVVTMSNSFSMGLFKSSIKNTMAPDVTSSEFTQAFLDKVKLLAEEVDLLNKSVDYQFVKWMLEFMCGSAPASVIIQIAKLHKNLLAITNLPGLAEKLSIANPNSEVQLWLSDLMYWLPQYEATGLGLMITKYCGTLKLTFISNSAYIEKKEESELFIGNMLKNIDILYDAATQKV